MEDLRTRHRKEKRDLQSQITQRKKSASKKTRKSVNDECEKLEKELEARQVEELAAFDPEASMAEAQNNADGTLEEDVLLDDLIQDPTGPASKPESLDGSAASTRSVDDEVAESLRGDTPVRRQNRQKARLARRAAEQEEAAARAAEEAQSLPNLRQRERDQMLAEFKRRGLVEEEVNADGHCLYSAVADQMRQIGRPLTLGEEDGEQEMKESVQQGDYKTVRQVAATYMAEHEADFVPFLEEPLKEYLHKVRDTGEWGGQVELLALAKAYGITINVLQGDGRVEQIDGGGEGHDFAWLAYYRHGFGLGEHYNSLRKGAQSSSNAPEG